MSYNNNPNSQSTFHSIPDRQGWEVNIKKILDSRKILKVPIGKNVTNIYFYPQKKVKNKRRVREEGRCFTGEISKHYKIMLILYIV